VYESLGQSVRRFTLPAILLMTGWTSGTSTIPAGIKVNAQVSPIPASQVLTLPTRTYDLDKPVSRSLLSELCSDSTLFLPNAPAEANFSGNEKFAYWKPSQLYTVDGQIILQNATGTIVKKPYQCAIVFGQVKGKARIFVKSKAQF
jgi:hypothetical protein